MSLLDESANIMTPHVRKTLVQVRRRSGNSGSNSTVAWVEAVVVLTAHCRHRY